MSARTLHDLFAAAASAHPDRAAVTRDCASELPVTLLYSDLRQLSAELSLLLRGCAPPRGAIGLCCRDDLFIPVWILG